MPALSHPTWTGTRVSFAGTSARAAAYEWPLLQAAVVPSIALAAGGIGLVATRTAYWIAIGYGAVMLVWWGLVIARREGLGLAATCAVVVVNASFALFIVALKPLVGHERSSVRGLRDPEEAKGDEPVIVADGNTSSTSDERAR